MGREGVAGCAEGVWAPGREVSLHFSGDLEKAKMRRGVVLFGYLRPATGRAVLAKRGVYLLCVNRLARVMYIVLEGHAPRTIAEVRPSTP